MNHSDTTTAHDTVDVLQYVRATILVIDRTGVIRQAHGGGGRPLGYAPGRTIGHNALEFIAPEDHETIATMFLWSDDLPIVAMPEPFPVQIIGSDGIARMWDCVPTGYRTDDSSGWVVTMSCRQEQAVSIDAMECFLHGGTSLEIAAVVAERSSYSSDDGWQKAALVVHRSARTSTEPNPSWQLLATASAPDPTLVDAVLTCLDDPAAPWNRLSPRAIESTSELPPMLQRAADEAGLPHSTAMAVGIDEESRIVFVRFSNFPRELQGNNRLADQAVAAVLQRALGAERARSMLDRAMRVDPLTGVANRLHFDEVVTANDRSAHAALFVDIDAFKSVNDTFGHAVGDNALREVARRIGESCRPHDLVARIGGDEFAVILRDVTGAEAEAIAARIRALMALPFAIEAGPATISVTVGVATPTSDLSLAELVRRADHAMLEGKHAARNATS